MIKLKAYINADKCTGKVWSAGSDALINNIRRRARPTQRSQNGVLLWKLREISISSELHITWFAFEFRLWIFQLKISNLVAPQRFSSVHSVSSSDETNEKSLCRAIASISYSVIYFSGSSHVKCFFKLNSGTRHGAVGILMRSRARAPWIERELEAAPVTQFSEPCKSH